MDTEDLFHQYPFKQDLGAGDAYKIPSAQDIQTINQPSQDDMTLDVRKRAVELYVNP